MEDYYFLHCFGSSFRIANTYQMQRLLNSDFCHSFHGERVIKRENQTYEFTCIENRLKTSLSKVKFHKSTKIQMLPEICRAKDHSLFDLLLFIFKECNTPIYKDHKVESLYLELGFYFEYSENNSEEGFNCRISFVLHIDQRCA